jgi:hypothetical protein
MILQTAILWVHVLSGVLLVGLCGTFILGVTLLGDPLEESSGFDISVVRQINRVCAVLAFAIPITGLANLLFAVREHGQLSGGFIEIVGAKIGLLGLMILALGASSRAARRTSPAAAGRRASCCQAKLRQIIVAYGVIVGAGIAALGLGLWLSGA